VATLSKLHCLSVDNASVVSVHVSNAHLLNAYYKAFKNEFSNNTYQMYLSIKGHL
jgi:hypothetical protein